MKHVWYEDMITSTLIIFKPNPIKEQLRSVKNDSIWRRVYLAALGQFAAVLVYFCRRI